MSDSAINRLPAPPPGKSGWPWTEAPPAPSETMPDGTPWPRVSIVTPSYNQALFLEETIRSVLLQGYPNLEYIIMDGGSTDGSVEIIRKYANHLAYWVSEPDEGQANAINQGFCQASGDILAWLNSDDTYEPGAIQSVVETFTAHPDAQLVYGEGWYINVASDRIRPCRFVRDTFQENYIYNRDPILQQSAFWRCSLWDKVGPLDESLFWVFDWDWFVRAYRQTNFCYLPRFLANYRIHSEAKTRSADIRRRAESAWITRKYGRWWHPNYLVQQSRIGAYHVAQFTAHWPHPLAALIQFAGDLPRRLAERAFYGMYTT